MRYPFNDQNIRNIASENFTINGGGVAHRVGTKNPLATRNEDDEKRKPAFEMYLGSRYRKKTVVKATVLGYTFFIPEGNNSMLTIEYIDKTKTTTIHI